MSRRRSRFSAQSGLTTLEAVGIVLAMIAGVVAGIVWLQLGSAKTGKISAAVDKRPAAAANEQATNEQADSQRDDNNVADEIRKLKKELLAELRGEVRQSGTSAANQQATPAAPQRDRNTTGSPTAAQSQHAQMGQRTLEYWNKLNGIILQEEQMRKVPLGGLTASNAAEFIRRRGEASKYAAGAIRSLSTNGVDPDVIGLAADIAGWYEHGNKLNSTAGFLLNKADSTSRRGQPGQAWSSSEKQHHASVDDINRRGDALRRKMIQKYGLAFPDLR